MFWQLLQLCMLLFLSGSPWFGKGAAEKCRFSGVLLSLSCRSCLVTSQPTWKSGKTWKKSFYFFQSAKYQGIWEKCFKSGENHGENGQSVIFSFSNLFVWTCIFFRESLTWSDAVGVVIPRKSPSNK